jgi:putative oxidoreductase
MFPRGLPGLALLLLRASAAIALLFNCYLHRSDVSGWIQPVVLLISLALCAGLLTPIAAIAALLSHGLIWANADDIRVVVAVVVTLDALALAMLGPGAYSIDGFRFGRRVVVIPPP